MTATRTKPSPVLDKNPTIDLMETMQPLGGWATSPSGEASAWVMITPELAARMLTHNTRNRNPRSKHENRLGKAMREGHWFRTHQGVAFDRGGVLIDGQHRLAQIQVTGIPQSMLVTLGLDPEVQAVTDTGLRRQALDFMEGTHRTTKAAAARILIAVDLLPDKITVGDLRLAMDMVDNRAVYEWAADPDSPMDLLDQYALQAHRASAVFSNGVGPGPLLAAGVYYPEHAEAWFAGLDRLWTREGLPAGDPLRALIARDASRRGRPTSVELRAYGAAAFAALKVARLRARGEHIATLKLFPDEQIKTVL